MGSDVKQKSKMANSLYVKKANFVNKISARC